MPQYQEGQRLQGSDGNIYVVMNGTPVRADSVAPQMPANPKFQYEGPQAAASVQQTQANAARSNAEAQKAAAEAPYAGQIAKSTAEQKAAEARKAAIDAENALKSASTRKDALNAYAASERLLDSIKEIEQTYQAGPGSTHGILGFQDYLPSPSNQAFDRAANSARGNAQQALGFSATQSNTPRETELNIGAYIPQASQYDSTILQTIDRLKKLQQNTREGAIRILGGVPDANGNIIPVPSQSNNQQQDKRPNAMTYLRTDGGAMPPPTAAPFGSNMKAGSYPPEYIQQNDALVKQLMAQNGGRLDPQAYAQARAQLDQKFNVQSDPQANQAWAAQINDFISKGGATVPTGVQAPDEKMSRLEQFRNSAINNPFGAAGAGYFNAYGLGIPQALAPDQYAAMQAAHPVANTVGEMAGAIGGTGLIGKAGARVLPSRTGAALRMFAGKGKAELAKNLAQDAIYGGLYGQFTQGDPVTGAMSAGLGSIGGQAVGKGLSTALGGAPISDAAKWLRDKGVPMTYGQMRGGFAKGTEDFATSWPGPGDMIARRYGDSLEGLSRAGLTDVGAPIGFVPTRVGKEGVADAAKAVGGAYDSATAGVNVPFDEQFAQDMDAIRKAADSLPADLRDKALKAIDNRISPVHDTGMMTGDQYQQMHRGLKGYKAEHTKSGFEGDYRDTISQAQDALRRQMERAGGSDLIQKLDNADKSYRLLKTFENAAYRADGAGYLPTASQLQDAVKITGKKFPGDNPLATLADNAQGVLPSKLPDSGTGKRLIAYGLGAGLLGAGEASDHYAGTDFVNPKTLGALALLTAGGTRTGQKAITHMMFDRPEWLKKLGNGTAKRIGMFGSAAVPLAISSSQ